MSTGCVSVKHTGISALSLGDVQVACVTLQYTEV